jgi:putative flippase GtrA
MPAVKCAKAEGPVFPPLERFVRFLVVGMVSTFVDFGILHLLVAYLGCWYLVAAACAYACGCTASYVLNRRFTFFDPSPASLGQFTLFAAVSVVGLLISLAVLALAVEVLGMQYLAGRACALIIAPFANYAGQRRFTFRGAAPDRFFH